MKEVISYFIKLGCTGFGGPIALVNQMQKDLVQKKQWLTESDFLKTVALIKILPGPLAFQMAVFLARKRAGFLGALASAVVFILPSFLLMIILAHFHSAIASAKYTSWLLDGMQVATVAVILVSINKLALPLVKDVLFWSSAFFAIVLRLFAGWSEVYIIIAAAGLGIVAALPRPAKNQVQSFGILELALLCLKAGGLVFGTGLAIVPFMQTDLVTGASILSRKDFLDAVTFGQLTPGPVLITVTFIGYKIAGLLGAVVATVCVFAPSFFNMTTWFPLAYRYLSEKAWMTVLSRAILGAIIGVLLLVVVSMSIEFSYFKMSVVFIMMMLMLYKEAPGWLMILLGGLIGILQKSF
jgi:chromate transporter